MSATPRKYIAWLLPDGLERRVEEDVVVLAAPEHGVRERDQAHGLVVRPVAQVGVEGDVEPGVRVTVEHLLLDQRTELLGGRTVFRRDRPVGREHLEEGNPGATSAGDGRVVVANPVVHRPRRKREHGREHARTGEDEPTPPREVRDERRENRQRQQHLVRGPDENEGGQPCAQGDEAPGRRRIERTYEEQRPDGQPGGEHRVARSLVVEGGVGRVDEQQERAEERRDASEVERRRAPREDRAGVREGEDELEEPDPADVEWEADDDRRQRRAKELELGERRRRVEELKVVGEVVPRVPAFGHRPAERLDPVHDERDREEGERGSPRGHERQQALPGSCHARRSRSASRRSSAPTLAARARPRSASWSAENSAAKAASSSMLRATGSPVAPAPNPR